MRKFTLTALALTASLAGFGYAQTVNLRLLETTDLHTAALGYDYYQDKATGEYGLANTATLIRAAKADAANSLLFDDGDLIQGNPLGDYVAKVNPLKPGQMHPMTAAMKTLGYDAASVGNHEFNYGLPFLEQVIAAAPFPYVNANVYNEDGSYHFKPYVILNKIVTATDGHKYALKIGVTGFAPPQIMQWDKGNLEGKVTSGDMVQAAQKVVPQMKADGANLVIVLAHSGIEATYATAAENAAAELTKVPGVDVVFSGHQHLLFPSPTFKDIPNVNLDKGTINGKPVVMAGYWGNNMGQIDLTLTRQGGQWVVSDSKSSLKPVWDAAAKKALVEPDAQVTAAVQAAHQGTLDYVRGRVADLSAPITSYFALVQDDPSVQIVSNAQIAYVTDALKGTPYEKLPVLSAAAPFKAGGRNGVSYYTDIPAGTIAIKNVADLYVYPNTVQAVVVTGAQVKEWLERAAGQFNQIDPNKKEVQPLVNEAFPTYNFDIIDGVTYQIDVTQPSRYDLSGKLVAPTAERIKNLSFQGKPIDPNAQFVVAT
ncbi:MAG TPA: bifunctional 2',3'-cyclic-nucleotide 2'-phosphodiesterase/3'-nucleotidase, partial [Deinococcales bacterium]|nr:bifunctional 2',3'-cyclic-nucleotide 2'-phosphodiesterase/3'-nucleotidase [Deinococcales bacterium]